MFYLSTKIEYGLNLLITLAKHNRRMSLRQIANETKMPYRFLNKLSRDLVAAGLIGAKEGKSGGFTLIKKPSDISVNRILKSLGEPLNLAQCFSHRHCPLGNAKHCKMRLVWAKIRKDIDRELKRTTLKDLI